MYGNKYENNQSSILNKTYIYICKNYIYICTTIHRQMEYLLLHCWMLLYS